MSNIIKLQSYLVPYLINNKRKVVMLSGVWGSGKTHFWHQAHEDSIEYHLTQSEKPHIYISLYGKASLKAIEDEVFIKAYNRSLDKDSDELDTIEKLSATFSSSSAISLIEKVTGFEIKDIMNMVNEQNQKNKKKDAKNFLSNLVICFDDFERKSKDVDLNDLFGFITNLSLEFGANIVIILNDDVFKDKEDAIFKNVKEKTVNKFFYFKPTPKELFDSIANNVKYDALEDYKADILKAITETEELNARVYIQVLDNCLEWLGVKENLDEQIIRVLVLGTFNFVLNHIVLDYQKIISNTPKDNDPFNIEIQRIERVSINYAVLDSLPSIIKNDFQIISNEKDSTSQYKLMNEVQYIKKLIENNYSIDNSIKQEELLKYINNNRQKLKALWKYGYKLYYVADVEEEIYNEIAQFIESGILI